MMDAFLSLLSVILGGVSFALYPICSIILAALFVYLMVVESGAMAMIKEGLAAISQDQRVQALVIIWGFGNFMEGMAGFGTAVAIPAAILVGVGFNPLKSVMMALVANTTPTVFGSVGVPLMTLAKESAVDSASLTWTSAYLQLTITALGPVLILLILDGWRALKGMVLKVLIADIAFLLPWMGAAKFLGCELPNILGGVMVMLVFLALSPKAISRAGFARQVHAWLPFGLVVVFLALAIPLPSQVRKFLSPPILVVLAGFVGGFAQGLAFKRMTKALFETVVKYKKAVFTIVITLTFARVMVHLGVIDFLARSLVKATGAYYPFFAPLVGALGGFLTGSGTSSNVLFGALQRAAADEINVSSALLAAANVMGAGIGKMICPQSIAIGVAAAALASKASEVMRRMLPWFLAIIFLACIITGALTNCV